MSMYADNPPRRAFTHTAESWYAKAVLKKVPYSDEILIGDYPVEGGTRGEFAIRWYQIGPEPLLSRVEAWSDSWDVLAQCKDLLDVLAGLEYANPSPDKVCELLKTLGFDDITKRVQHD